MAASLLVVLLKRSFPMPFVQYARTNSILARLHAFALSITNRAGLAEGLSYIPDRWGDRVSGRSDAQSTTQPYL